MTGPQHYTEAERLITEFVESKHGYTITPTKLTLALIHATLAQAAATALALAGQFTLADCDAWQNVAGGGVT